MNSPIENPDQLPPPPSPDKGSMLIGFFVGWGVLVASIVVAGAVIAGVGAMMNWNSASMVIAQLIGLLPIASMIGLVIWYAQRGKTRSALGVAATFGSLLALALLLVAACFGLMSGTNFGR
jgi:hypothetical protein